MIGTVLIVDEVAINRILLKSKLTQAGYHVLMAADGAAALGLARREVPDLVLLDSSLSDMSSLAVLNALRSDPDLASLDVVMMAGPQDGHIRLEAARAGVDAFLAKPVEESMLLARLRSLQRGRETIGGLDARTATFGWPGLAEPAAQFRAQYQAPGLVALLMGRDDRASSLIKALSTYRSDRMISLTTKDIIEPRDPLTAPDVFVIDCNLGGPSVGLQFMTGLRSRPETRHAQICIITHDRDGAMPAMAFDLGADDLMDDSVGPEEMALRLHRLVLRKREGDRLRAQVNDGLRLAMTDPLTGLPNRRYGLSQLGLIAETAGRENRDFALMVLDLDRFKNVNDLYGHAAGDKVLIEVGRRLAQNLRGNDLIARIGGEEFLICLPDTTLAESQQVAQRLCQVIECEPVSIGPGQSLRVTISIGLALSREARAPLGAIVVDEVFERADRALLSAKGAGRNQVTIARSAAA